MSRKLYPPSRELKERAKQLRWQMTPAEERLWEKLHKKQLHGLKFRRQHPLYRFIFDFYCHAHKLVIEVDGGIHNKQKEYDARRDEWLRLTGHKVLRFTNEEILNNIEDVLNKIAETCGVGK